MLLLLNNVVLLLKIMVIYLTVVLMEEREGKMLLGNIYIEIQLVIGFYILFNTYYLPLYVCYCCRSCCYLKYRIEKAAGEDLGFFFFFFFLKSFFFSK